MTLEEKAEVRRETINEIIAGIDQLIDIFSTGGQAPLTGHAYDPKEADREIKLLGQLKESLTEMKEKT